ncbi:hypothetical protein Vadar_015469 [Vaccinium darrowii]|uniref:Uncharacterized protein n=1 Tax=Vaccinium darrowii TaxID=229202 RepID=A0ACB7YN63_9ERIC|nr:hypothetical protein Vadar_015469 [Vaccinium darrowii]
MKPSVVCESDSPLCESLIEEAMAEKPDTESRRSGIYSGRMTSFVVVSCMMAAVGGALFGYDIGISGGVSSMDTFLKKFYPDVYTKMEDDTTVSNYCKFDSQLLTLFTSSLYIAGFIASFAASSFTGTFGRRPSILFGGATHLVGALVAGAAPNIYLLMVGRVLLGVGLGFTNQAVPLYLSEMAPTRYRGAFSNGFQLCVNIGALSANLVSYGTEKMESDWGWRICLATAGVPAALLALGALFLQETPNSVMQRTEDHQKAKSILVKLRGTEDVKDEFDDLINASTLSKTVTHPFLKMTERKYRPQLVMAIAIPFFQQVTGINAIAFYAPELFRTTGLGESASLLSAVVIRVVNLTCTFISMLIVDKFGRKLLFAVGGIQMAVSQIAVGSIMATQLGDYGEVSEGYALALLVLICVYVSGYGWSWGPLGWLVPSEIFPLEIRSAGQSIRVAVSFLFTIIIAQTYLAMLCQLKSGIFFCFGGWVVAMTAFVYLFLPETKNVPIEQVDRVWREHWFWKRIVGTEKVNETGA